MISSKKFNKKKDSFLFIATGYSDGLNTEEETSFVQLGLLYLGTVLKEHNYRAKIMSTYYPDTDYIKEKIKKENIKIVGFYTTTENIYRSFNCARILKKACPYILIIMGGPHASVMDAAILEKEEYIDLIVRKEGENTIVALAELWFEGTGDLENIKGITYRKNNLIHSAPDAPFIEDLDSLPIPDRDLLEEPLKSFDKIYPRMITGRGCPFECAFCYEGFSGSNYRFRSAENILDEIDYLMKRDNIKYVRFMDDSFTARPSRTYRVCKGLKERAEKGKSFVWFAEGRVDVLAKNPRLIYEMSLAGLVNLHIGVECADEKVLDIYKKNITLEQIETVVSTCAKAEIPVISVNFIIGGPLESEEIYKKNLAFVKKLMNIAPGRIHVTSSILVPFPGTRIRKEPEKFGLNIIDPDCKSGTSNETCFAETENLNKYDLVRYKRNFDREVSKIIIEMADIIPREVIMQHFNLQFCGIKTELLKLLSFDMGIRKFLNLKAHKSYLSLDEIDKKNIFDFCPSVLYPLNYNEDNLIILDKLQGAKFLNPEDTQLYELSSGKMSFKEISDIAKEKIFSEMEEEEVYKKIIDFYRRIDKDYAVIFSRV